MDKGITNANNSRKRDTRIMANRTAKTEEKREVRRDCPYSGDNVCNDNNCTHRFVLNDVEKRVAEALFEWIDEGLIDDKSTWKDSCGICEGSGIDMAYWCDCVLPTIDGFRAHLKKQNIYTDEIKVLIDELPDTYLNGWA